MLCHRKLKQNVPSIILNIQVILCIFNAGFFYFFKNLKSWMLQIRKSLMVLYILLFLTLLLHNTLYSACRVNVFAFSPLHSFRFPIQFPIGLPLPLLLSTLPSITALVIPSPHTTCPKYLNFLLFTMASIISGSNSHILLTSLLTHLFVLLYISKYRDTYCIVNRLYYSSSTLHMSQRFRNEYVTCGLCYSFSLFAYPVEDNLNSSKKVIDKAQKKKCCVSGNGLDRRGVGRKLQMMINHLKKLIMNHLRKLPKMISHLKKLLIIDPPEKAANDDKASEKIADKESPEETANDEKPSEKVADNDQPSEKTANDDKPSEKVVDKEKPSEKTANDDKPSEKVADNDQPSEKTVNDDKPSEKVADNDQPPEKADNDNKLSKREDVMDFVEAAVAMLHNEDPMSD
ncbi:Eukaryotic translation initiation factor 3 subunit A [Nymphon striatum]|nr:Eukaryotic translation initiation factor 3 subunit A [Nymphon striatum]